ncbi:MAG: response regulator transcription factor [Oligoflexia bacterium]|nr:response regulator transcription factor [Oligoflexia bacterium]
MKVLIVDDSKTVAQVIGVMLKEEHHLHLWAKNGQEAIDILKKESGIDIILLDWNMPVIDGPSFLQINKDQKITSIPIIMLTTENKCDKITKIMDMGASEYITKPFTKDILFSKIQMVLNK